MKIEGYVTACYIHQPQTLPGVFRSRKPFARLPAITHFNIAIKTALCIVIPVDKKTLLPLEQGVSEPEIAKRCHSCDHSEAGTDEDLLGQGLDRIQRIPPQSCLPG